MAGLNASQVHNDEVGGYNKLGIHAGLRAVARLQEKVDLTIELLYAQRGSRSKINQTIEPLKIGLQYAEVPVLISYKDWLQEEEGYYKVQILCGLSYGRLLKATSEGSAYDDVLEKFSTSDLSFTLGAELFTSKHFGFGMRWTRSITPTFNRNQDPSTVGRNSLFGYFLSFRTMYVF